MELRAIQKTELSTCLDIIHRSFKSVADKLNLTKENCPGHTSFMPMEKLEQFWDWGFLMYGLFSEKKELVGYMSLSKVPDRETVFALHNICVLPEYRKKGYGKILLDYAKQKVKELNGDVLFVDFIEEHTALKEWYLKNGFVHKGTEKYEHLPFTVGKAEYYIGVLFRQAAKSADEMQKNCSVI